MKTQHKEPKFNSNELNKILPSYLLDEIDNEEKKEENSSTEKESFDLPILKESNIVRKNILIYLYFIHLFRI